MGSPIIFEVAVLPILRQATAVPSASWASASASAAASWPRSTEASKNQWRREHGE